MFLPFGFPRGTLNVMTSQPKFPITGLSTLDDVVFGRQQSPGLVAFAFQDFSAVLGGISQAAAAAATSELAASVAFWMMVKGYTLLVLGSKVNAHIDNFVAAVPSSQVSGKRFSENSDLIGADIDSHFPKKYAPQLGIPGKIDGLIICPERKGHWGISLAEYSKDIGCCTYAFIPGARGTQTGPADIFATVASKTVSAYWDHHVTQYDVSALYQKGQNGSSPALSPIVSFNGERISHKVVATFVPAEGKDQPKDVSPPGPVLSKAETLRVEIYDASQPMGDKSKLPVLLAEYKQVTGDDLPGFLRSRA